MERGEEGKGERGKEKVRKEETINFNFFLLLGTHSVTSFIVSDC